MQYNKLFLEFLLHLAPKDQIMGQFFCLVKIILHVLLFNHN